jgi:hypothetical protein
MVKRFITLTVVLFLLLSIPTFAFLSDFEGEGDTVIMYERFSGETFSYVDAWFARVGPNDRKPIEVINATGDAYEGDHSLGIILFDPADTGAENWDFNSRPGESSMTGINHFADVVAGDTISFQVWIPPEGEIDGGLVFVPYAQYHSWGTFDENDSISLDSIYDTEGLEDGGWREFTVILPDTIGGADLDAMGIQFEFPDTVNPDYTIYVDYITSETGAGIPVSPGDASILSLPAASMNNLKYEISASTLIHIGIYNPLGQKVKEIVPGVQAAGAYSLDVDLASGVYLYKVTAGKVGKSSKLIILQ